MAVYCNHARAEKTDSYKVNMKFPYRRVLILGCGGAGKSTFARAMGERFSLPVVHLDKIWWLPGWVTRSEEEFDALLRAELEKPCWVIDGNYERTAPLRLQSCDAAVFLDIPEEECVRSVFARAEAYRGKSRPDMTEGCEEEVHGDFLDWIKNFNENKRGKMLRLLEESRKPYFVFSSREAAYAWINDFESEERKIS